MAQESEQWKNGEQLLQDEQWPGSKFRNRAKFRSCENSSCLDRLNNFGINSLQKLQN